jgi:hypothetical protein
MRGVHRASAALRRLAWLLVGVLFGLALLLAIPDRKPEGPPREQTPSAPAVGAAAGSAAAVAPTAAANEARDERGTADANAAVHALQQGHDLHALALELLPRAEADDAEAQYSLALITSHCLFELKRYADRAAFEEFLETVPRRSGIDPEQYATFQRRSFEACDGFRADPIHRYIADPDWSARAADAGHPLAALERELRVPGGVEARDPAALRSAARAALASGRPEAFMLLLELEFPDDADDEARDATPNAIAWWLLACQRGYPCGPEARWRHERRAFRSGPSGDLDWEDALLFDLPAHEREQARDRAAELGRALDEGELDAVLPLMVR